MALCAVVIVFCAVGFNALTVVPRAYAADPTVDIAAQLSGPTSELKGKPFTYDVTVSNVGTGDAGGSTFTFTAGSGSTGLKIVCASASGGAACPTNLALSGLNATGTVGTFPVGGVVHLTVTGFFGFGTSSTATLSVNPPSGSTDTNPASNTVSQQTALSGEAIVSVTKTQDKASVANGEARTYTVTYRNDGPADLRGVRLDDQYTASGGGVVAVEAASCSATGGAVCPVQVQSLPYQSASSYLTIFPNNIYTSSSVLVADLPANSSLTFVYTVRTTITSCSTQSTIGDRNQAQMQSFPAGITVKDVNGNPVSYVITQVNGTITGISVCPSATVAVTKVQDKASVANGEARTYTVTYRNDGPADLRGVRLDDQYTASGGGVVAVEAASCSATGGAVCPVQVQSLPYQSASSYLTIFPNNIYTSSSVLVADLPANSSLTFVYTVRTTITSCSTQSTIGDRNQAQMQSFPAGITVKDVNGNPVSYVITQVNGTIDVSSVVDVSTTTSVSNPNPQPLGALTATSTISNSCHTATNVPVTVKLPENGFLAPQPATPTCTASGGATCPADLRFDAATNSILGTVGSIPAGGNVVLSLLGTAGVIPPTTASYKITSTAPAANDTIPTVGTLNESNATFAYSNVQSAVTAKVTVSGGPAGGWSGSMDGTLVCQTQGSFPFTLDVVNGASQVTSVVAALWEHDTCTATLTRPDPPAGYSWGDWTAGPSFTRTNIVGAQHFDFATSLVSDAVPFIPQLPFTGGRSAVSFTITGLSLLGLSLLFIVWRRRKVIS
ncbi:LPXTG-motif cell wall-anchored protein [Arcanobacterium pluranimalium]|uniref:LPXTG cell wall anchor domain-containing protein n=1 Tax=Arcanobacterium pluranimalium TaxID=108028 RepID=UPI00195BBBF0|nr:LPXTG-motif cell wall-anchored protein [Arcanobacterium pluranimalium]